MDSILNRLRQIRAFTGLRQVEFSQRIGMAGNSFSQIETGSTPLKDRHISLICFTFGINESWLRTGKGEMLDMPPQVPFEILNGKEAIKLSPEESKFLSTFWKLTKQNRAVARKQMDILLESQEEKEPYPNPTPAAFETVDPEPPYITVTPEEEGFDNVESIDYDMVGILYLGDYAATAAGPLREMLDDPGERQIQYISRNSLRADPRQCFCLIVRGTSMIQAGISDGDRVVLKLTEEPENGAIMLVSYEGDSTLKRIMIRKGKVFLRWEDGSGREEEIKAGYQFLGKLMLILNMK